MMVMDKPHPLAAEWRREADLYERRGLANPAAMARSFAAELEFYECERGLEALPLKEASAESGYSDSHLSRLVNEGKLENAGKEGAPRIRRKDLPTKPPRSPASNGPDLVGTVLRGQQ